MGLNEVFSSYDAVGLAELVRRGEGTPEELLDAAIERVERLNSKVNAVVTKMYDEARRFIAVDLPKEGSFRGVPFLLKDLKATYRGVPTTNGSRFFANDVATEDSDLVGRHKRA